MIRHFKKSTFWKNIKIASLKQKYEEKNAPQNRIASNVVQFGITSRSLGEPSPDKFYFYSLNSQTCHLLK